MNHKQTIAIAKSKLNINKETTITLNQITNIINSSSDNELAQTLKDQGVFDQKLSTPCLQVIADKFTTMTGENIMTLWQAMGSGEEAIHNVPKIQAILHSVCENVASEIQKTTERYEEARRRAKEKEAREGASIEPFDPILVEQARNEFMETYETGRNFYRVYAISNSIALSTLREYIELLKLNREIKKARYEDMLAHNRSIQMSKIELAKLGFGNKTDIK